MQPQALFLAGYTGFSKFLFYIPLMITILFSLKFSKGSSGKQKCFVILAGLKLWPKKKLLEKFIPALKEYYKEENHPIRLLIKEIKDETN